MADTKERIKEKLSIVDVVTPYVKLTRAGKYYKGLSPFNKEKTPSFFVNPERGTYYCFSSSQGGDMFSFISSMEGVDFKGALKILAEKAGVPLVFSSEGRAEQDARERLYDLLARVEQYYVSLLDTESEAYAYARARGLSDATIQTWRLGYAPSEWRGVLETFTAQGFTVDELLKAGLIKEADEKRGTYYDRFRGRLMFPIMDSAGRTVAFTGRALQADEQAKYLNSPETDLFKKSHILHGMHVAKDAIRTRGFTLLVEGQFDLLLLHQVGFCNTVALSGTALSSTHLTLMKRYADNLMLALDSDRAGLAASAKNALVALRAGMKVKAVKLPEGKDPADLIREDKELFLTRAKDAESIVEFFLRVLKEKEQDVHKLVLAVEKVVLPLIHAIQSPLEREHFVGVVARHIETTPDAVRASLVRVREEHVLVEPQHTPLASTVDAGSDAYTNQEHLIRALITLYKDTPLAKHLEAEYARIIGTLPEGDLPERVLFEAGLLYGESPREDSAHDLLRTFEKGVLTRRLTHATHLLRRAESERNTKEIEAALATCKDISTRLSMLS